MATTAERFALAVQRTPTCWLWTKGTSSYGYGKLKVAGRSIGAHRVSWELHKGPIPEGLWVLHKCDVPACVNPEHLFLGDQKANMQDSKQKGRRCRGEKHALHKLTPELVVEIRNSVGGSRVVAKQYAVSHRTIQLVRRREVWAHIFPLSTVEVVGRLGGVGVQGVTG